MDVLIDGRDLDGDELAISTAKPLIDGLRLEKFTFVISIIVIIVVIVIVMVIINIVIIVIITIIIITAVL